MQEIRRVDASLGVDIHIEDVSDAGGQRAIVASIGLQIAELVEDLDTLATAHVVLFSSDLTLTYDKLFAYYCLRFQIEFNFRDAKQFWGLEDFMNITPTAVTNAANLSLFMVNLAYRLLLDFRPTQPAFSVLDLKALARGQRYVAETIQSLPQKPEPVLLNRVLRQVSSLGQIHRSQPTSANP